MSTIVDSKLGMTKVGDIIIEPFKIKILNEMSITRVPNEHTKLHLSGIIEQDLKDSYIDEVQDKTVVTISRLVKKEDPETMVIVEEAVPIFSGLVQSLLISEQAQVYQVEIDAVSHTKRLDIREINQSYQNPDMPFEFLLKSIVTKYEKGDIYISAIETKPLTDFTLQYGETDWAFLKRMASRYHVPLVAEDKYDAPQIFFGVPQKDHLGDISQFKYTISKNIAPYRSVLKNTSLSPFESEYITYQFYSDQIFEIGDMLTLGERPLIIKQAHIHMQGAILNNTYIAVQSGYAFRVQPEHNQKITGLSLTGHVIDRQKDEIKVLLDIDKQWPWSVEDSRWFKWTPPYTSTNGGGFYCMPEMDEKVRLYIPDEKEAGAIATNCVRQEFETNSERGNPDIKYWRTIDGKEIMFTPDGIKIRCVDNEIFINLTEKLGITLQSNYPIDLLATNGAGINFDADGVLTITGGEEVDLSCGASYINMRKGKTEIVAPVVHQC